MNDLPDDDHIVRYIRPKLVVEDGQTADGAAFCLRPDESGLSVNWLEAFNPGKENRLAEVRRLCRLNVKRLNVKRSGRFAQMHVGTVKDTVSEELDTFRIFSDPLEIEGKFEEDPSHAQISGLPPGDSDEAMLIGDLMAECVIEMHHAIHGNGTL